MDRTDDPNLLEVHDAAASSAETYDEYRATVERRLPADHDFEDVLRRVGQAGGEEVTPVPERAASGHDDGHDGSGGERRDAGASESTSESAGGGDHEPPEKFDAWRGHCTTADGELRIDQGVSRYVIYPSVWVISGVILLAGLYSFATGWTYVAAGGRRVYGWRTLLLLGGTVPGFTLVGVLLARATGDTGTARIPLDDVERVRVVPRSASRRGASGPVPEFVVHYRTGRGRKRRRLRLDPKATGRANLGPGIAFFESLGLPPNPDAVPLDGGLCVVRDGRLTFEYTASAVLGYRAALVGATLSVALGAAALTGLLDPVIDWLVTAGVVDSRQLVGVLVLVGSVVGSFWLGGAALARRPFATKPAVETGDVRRARIEETASGRELVVERGPDATAVTATLVDEEAFPGYDVVGRAHDVLRNHGVPVDEP